MFTSNAARNEFLRAASALTTAYSRRGYGICITIDPVQGVEMLLSRVVGPHGDQEQFGAHGIIRKSDIERYDPTKLLTTTARRLALKLESFVVDKIEADL